MPIVKMFAALLVAACAAQTLATQARAEVSTEPVLSLNAEPQGCGWKHPYHYRYHYRAYRPSPIKHPHAPRPRRKFPTD